MGRCLEQRPMSGTTVRNLGGLALAGFTVPKYTLFRKQEACSESRQKINPRTVKPVPDKPCVTLSRERSPCKSSEHDACRKLMCEASIEVDSAQSHP